MEMRKRLAAFTVIGFALIALPLGWAARVGDPAPDFTATDTNGRVHKLNRIPGQICGLGMDKPRLPLHSEALQQRKHAAPAA